MGCRRYSSNQRQLIAGTFASGALALNSAKLYMDPEATMMAYVSSHNERFKAKNQDWAYPVKTSS